MGRRSGRNKRVLIRRSPSPTSKLSGAWVDSRKLLSEDAPKKYVPADVWEIDSLRKALKKALNEIYDVYDDESQLDANLRQQERRDAKAMLTHILNCWAANIEWNPEIRRQQSAGPFFLMHILRGQYKDHERGDVGSSIDFSLLERRDRKFLNVILEACATTAHSFHVFLARFSRRAHRTATSITDPDDGTTVEVLLVEQTDCFLHSVIHVAGSEIKIVPKVSEDDLVDKWYFEGKPPDEYIYEGKVAGHMWGRAVVVLAPHDFADEFLGYPADDLGDDVVWFGDIGRWVAVDEDAHVFDEEEEEAFVKFSSERHPAKFKVDENLPTVECISMQGRLSDRAEESEDEEEEEEESENFDDGELSGYVRTSSGRLTPQVTGDYNSTPLFLRVAVPNEGRTDPRGAYLQPFESYNLGDINEDSNEDLYVEDEEAMVQLALQELAERQAALKGEQNVSDEMKE